jgi:hypothetical protein
MRDLRDLCGCPLFDVFFRSDTEILTQTVEILGRLPNPWWSLLGSGHCGSRRTANQRVSKLKSMLAFFYRLLKALSERNYA